MKKLVIIATTLLLMIGHTGFTQNMTSPHPYFKQNQKQKMMMMQKNGEMQEMMKMKMCPMCGQMVDQDMSMKKYEMIVNQLPNMQEQLSLSDMQMEQLDELQVSFKKQQVDFQSELKKKQIMLKKLLDDMAPANQIEKQMKECADIKISMGVAAYETAGKMKALLNNDQREVLKNKITQQGGMMNLEQNGMRQKGDGMMNHDHGEKMQSKNKQ